MVERLVQTTVNGNNGLSFERNWTNGTGRRVEEKGHLFIEGDRKTHVYLIASGALCLYKLLADGRQVINFAYEGDLVGLDSTLVEVCNAQATVTTHVKCLPFAVLLKAAKQSDQVALRLYEAVSVEPQCIPRSSCMHRSTRRDRAARNLPGNTFSQERI